MVYHNNEGGKCAKYIVQQLQEPAHLSAPSPFKTMYDKFAKRILWMDGNVVPGAFQMNTAWYFNVPERDPVFTEHSHADTSELIGFFGTDPENPYDLGGEIEFTMMSSFVEAVEEALDVVLAGEVPDPDWKS